jgi:hypothetical protein
LPGTFMHPHRIDDRGNAKHLWATTGHGCFNTHARAGWWVWQGPPEGPIARARPVARQPLRAPH